MRIGSWSVESVASQNFGDVSRSEEIDVSHARTAELFLSSSYMFMFTLYFLHIRHVYSTVASLVGVEYGVFLPAFSHQRIESTE
jgi:hypothetical protein